MAERKIINKYYPPDFDASKTIRVRKPERKGPKQQTIRLMTPFSMRCNSCGEYIYKGKKFNARKEVTSEKYLGISIIRFYIRCPRCSAEITFKTDPKNSDYSAEKGARRNYEPWRGDQKEEETQEERLDRLMQEQEQQVDEPNAMERLESKVLDSKREIATADALDELRMRNARIDRVDPLSVLDARDETQAAKQRELTEARLNLEEQEDELEARAAFESADGSSVRRINVTQQDVSPPLSTLNSSSSVNMFAPEALKKRKNTKSALLGVAVAPKKKRLI